MVLKYIEDLLRERRLRKEQEEKAWQLLWIVGKIKSRSEFSKWEMMGVFDSEEKAVKCCKDWRYFVGPMTLNEKLKEEPQEWIGCYYPKIHLISSDILKKLHLEKTNRSMNNSMMLGCVFYKVTDHKDADHEEVYLTNYDIEKGVMTDAGVFMLFDAATGRSMCLTIGYLKEASFDDLKYQISLL